MIVPSLSNLQRTLRTASIIIMDIQAVALAIEKTSLMPVLRRWYNTQVGREVFEKAMPLFWKRNRSSK